MTAPLFLQYHGDGEFRTPSPHSTRYADKEFVVGETYQMVENHDRSSVSHKHYFASIHEAWSNLPEAYADLPFAQSSDHLRAYALIKTGWCDSHTIVCSSKAEAARMASFIRPIDAFSVVSVNEATVTRFTAKSQSMKAMGKRDFQKSKDEVLDFLDALIGTTAGQIQQERAA